MKIKYLFINPVLSLPLPVHLRYRPARAVRKPCKPPDVAAAGVGVAQHDLHVAVLVRKIWDKNDFIFKYAAVVGWQRQRTLFRA